MSKVLTSDINKFRKSDLVKYQKLSSEWPNYRSGPWIYAIVTRAYEVNRYGRPHPFVDVVTSNGEIVRQIHIDDVHPVAHKAEQ